MNQQLRRKWSSSLHRRLYHYALKRLLASGKPYQPIGEHSSSMKDRPDEAFETRWQSVVQAANRLQTRNLLDVGCSEGYFTRRAATELGLISLGVDSNRTRLRLGTGLADLEDQYGYGFLAQKLTPESIRQLPCFDLVLCFSVVHHIIAAQGPEAGVRFLASLRQITGSGLLFDMGTPLETSHRWAPALEFLLDDIPGRTADYLRSAGFASVEHIGDAAGHFDSTSRPIFLCRP